MHVLDWRQHYPEHADTILQLLDLVPASLLCMFFALDSSQRHQISTLGSPACTIMRTQQCKSCAAPWQPSQSNPSSMTGTLADTSGCLRWHRQSWRAVLQKDKHLCLTPKHAYMQCIIESQDADIRNPFTTRAAPSASPTSTQLHHPVSSAHAVSRVPSHPLPCSSQRSADGAHSLPPWPHCWAI